MGLNMRAKIDLVRMASGRPQSSPDAFNHKEVGYPVTNIYNRAKHKSYMDNLLFTFSCFSIHQLRVDTKKIRLKVMQREREYF